MPRGMPRGIKASSGCRDAARHHQCEIREPAGRMAALGHFLFFFNENQKRVQAENEG